MWTNDLTDLSWGQLEKRIPKRTVREKDEHPPSDPSDSEDEEEMAGYANLFQMLQDPLVVEPASKDATETCTLTLLEQLKLNIVVDIWQPGKSLGDSRSQSAVKRTRTGDSRSLRTSGSQLSATPVFNSSKHDPALMIPSGETAWPTPGQASV